jgi:anti-sigma B factor antagonist
MVQMSAIRYPIKMVGGVPVVRPPAEIDVTNADALSATILAVAERGQATLVVNMKRTHFCDSAGLHVLVRAQERAVAEGGELRLVIRHAGLLRTFAVADVDQMFPIFSRLREALDQPPPLIAAGIGTGLPPGGR